MPSNTFNADVVKRGNSYTITIPKGIAEVYGLNRVQVTLEDVKKQ